MRRTSKELYRARRERLMATEEGRQKLLEESRAKEARRKDRDRTMKAEQLAKRRARLNAKKAADPVFAEEYRRKAREAKRRYKARKSAEQKRAEAAKRKPPTREQMDRKNERQNAKRREYRLANPLPPREIRTAPAADERRRKERERQMSREVRLRATPEGLEALRARDRAKYRARFERDPERMRAMWRAKYRRQAGPPASSLPSGSAYVAAAPSPARDLLRRLAALAPRRDSHDEVVAEAALLVLEGMSEAEAVKAAARNVSRGESPFRYTKPLEECFWL